MQDHEQQSSTEARGALPPGLSPGLAAALADPEVAREAALYAATLPGQTGSGAPVCDCSCHRCCVPPDEACEDCPENHGATR